MRVVQDPSLAYIAGVIRQKAEISERRALRPPDSHTAGINPAARCRILYRDSPFLLSQNLFAKSPG